MIIIDMCWEFLEMNASTHHVASHIVINNTLIWMKACVKAKIVSLGLDVTFVNNFPASGQE